MADIVTGLVGWWKMDNAGIVSNGTVSRYSTADSSTNGNTGVLSPINAGPTSVTGKIAECLSFVANNSTSVLIANSPALNPASISIAAWIKTSSTDASSQIFTKDSYGGNPTGRVWQFCIGTSGHVEFIPFTASSLGDYTGSVNVVDGNWHFVVGTFDQSKISIYVDGTEDGTGLNLSGALRTGQTNNAYIGAAGLNSFVSFNGLIDELRLYNRALSADDVIALYAWTGSNSNLPLFRHHRSAA